MNETVDRGTLQNTPEEKLLDAFRPAYAIKTARTGCWLHRHTEPEVLPCVHIAVPLSTGNASVHAEMPKSMGDSWSVCCPYLTDSVLLSQCKVVVTERACDHTLYNQWQGPRKGSSDDERRRAQGSSQALRKSYSGNPPFFGSYSQQQKERKTLAVMLLPAAQKETF